MAEKYKAVSVAEKRAEYELLGKPWPTDVYWKAKSGRSAGGYFASKDGGRRYRQTENGRKKRAEAQARYLRSEKGRIFKDRANWSQRIRKLKAERPIVAQQLAEATREVQRLEREVQCLS